MAIKTPKRVHISSVHSDHQFQYFLLITCLHTFIEFKIFKPSNFQSKSISSIHHTVQSGFGKNGKEGVHSYCSKMEPLHLIQFSIINRNFDRESYPSCDDTVSAYSKPRRQCFALSGCF